MAEHAHPISSPMSLWLRSAKRHQSQWIIIKQLFILQQSNHFHSQQTPLYGTGEHLLTHEPPHQKTNNLHMRKNKGTDQLCSNCTALISTFGFAKPNYPSSATYIQSLKLQVLFCESTDRSVSDLVGNPNCWFSHAMAHII